MASTQRAVGPAQESQDEGLEIRNMNRGADVLCFSIAVSPQEDVGLGRSMRYHMPPAAGEGGESGAAYRTRTCDPRITNEAASPDF